MEGSAGAGSLLESVPPPPGDSERAGDRYFVKQELATGGMGTVYHVVDRITGEERALKRIHADSISDPDAIGAFEREYQVLAGLDHPRIIRVFEYGVDETGPYYTMELLEGQDMREAAPLPVHEACLYLRDLATSLALLHARGLIHRDLSPSNVRMTSDGHCKLLDFGALTVFGASPMVVGTPPGIPPEALDGAPLDQRADLYALGALGYWMLTGHHAFAATSIQELSDVLAQAPVPPSEHMEGIPPELEALVMSLLSEDPLARPSSAAEVISRLNVIAGLEPEDEEDVERLAESFFLTPRFIGRAGLLGELATRTASALEGHGSAILVSAVAGMGRTRLLEEVGLRAQVTGARVLRIDASMFRQRHGTARALASRLLEAVPEPARRLARDYPSVIELIRRRGAPVPPPAEHRPDAADRGSFPGLEDAGRPIEDWIAEVARTVPLVVEVDNVADADAASLGMLAALARVAPERRLLLLATERVRSGRPASMSLKALRSQCTHVELPGLESSEMLELARSLFGDAPNLERFAEWLYGQTAGSPLHCIEVSRHLVSERVVRYIGGMWVLPVERPDARLNVALEDALSVRIGRLNEEARQLAECLSLQRQQATLQLCRLLSDGADERHVLALLDELARNGVLFPGQESYRFSSAALREALYGGMDDTRREHNHRRLGEAYAALAGDDNPALRIEAGWHLIRGGEDTRGADMIAAVTYDSVTVRHLHANLTLVGRPLEAALQVYKRQRRSIYERMPLLAALAHAGYYEDRIWEQKYGDETIDVIENISGLRIANRLMRFLGRPIALIIGLLFARVRFMLVPKRKRHYSFHEVLVQLFGLVTALTGAASAALDVQRAHRVVRVIEPFSFLPKRSTPAGVYTLGKALSEMGSENQAVAFRTIADVIERFRDPRQFPSLPQDARVLTLSGALFARGIFAVFREDGSGALESATALDATGIKMYQMIASQLRFLYYMNRGEFPKAAPHRQQVEIHAAHVGSAQQVETWEPSTLMATFVEVEDLVGMTRVEDRLAHLARTIPSLELYHHLAQSALRFVQGTVTRQEVIEDIAEIRSHPDRSFIGWAATQGIAARAWNRLGEHAEAKAVCEYVLARMTDEDREFVTLFLPVDVEMAYAEAALGDIDAALERIDGLLERFRDSDHPLLMGTLNEARARIAWSAGLVGEYEDGLAQVERWFRPTGTPGLIARCDRLATLGGGTSDHRRMSSAPPMSSSARTRRARKPGQSDGDATTAATVRTNPRRGR